MIELAFLGRSGDSQSIVFTDAEGARYSVAITDALRQAVRRGTLGPAPEPTQKTPLRPRDIQSLLRSGLSASEIAQSEGIDIEDVTKYESPVLAEIAWAINRAQLCRIGDAPGTPILEDLVINRLAARGVDSASFSWNARRQPGEDWEVSLTFIQAGVERQATWSLRSDAASVKAIDEEATWLTESAAPIAPVSAFFPSPSDFSSSETESIEALVEQANTQRGRPQPVLDEVDEDDVPLDEAEENSFDEVVPESTEVAENIVLTVVPDQLDTADDDEILPGEGELFEIPSNAQSESVPPKKHNGRRPVPSWDEIVFGSKTD
ncbi:DUF3071 domain-containing protein [Actinomycetaceae bacterium WB03_NA08]|uniref:DUF3071 domain-containing protein n=1 Tax=Scrofimicrobium canadense TaxID=2652290 RepID=A0A6N7W8K5_9ACTO|nr:septation protein SepH [Scrofimicrobium canadense]MSS84833.1 DUF3071 domain-containing protein [Scrofimicrobium canadense]